MYALKQDNGGFGGISETLGLYMTREAAESARRRLEAQYPEEPATGSGYFVEAILDDLVASPDLPPDGQDEWHPAV